MLLGFLGWRRRLTFGLAVVGLLATLALGFHWGIGSWSGFQQIADPGVRYGNERGTLVYGICDVTIPAAHASGEIERPSILHLEVREDVARHVVLQSTEPQAEDEFFSQLRTTVESADRSEVFVFVHGYNVTFDGAARRTAQIAHDVGFSGAPIFFSWPSQGGLLKYTVDENNVEWAVPHLRKFLIDVTRRSGAQSVNLIAHSMGNRALTAAMRELQQQLGEETALFNQIILAAPDVDAEIFRRDLAPALVQSARRVTLYASSNDQALLASKQVHGHARAGDSGTGLVVLPGIETIDVSMLDTSLLGHSYYGSSDPILLDIRGMIREALPAAQRPFLLPRSYGGLTYWVFEKMRATATRDVPQLQ
jgi:esterase/lipase superfamily enzyme